jgi:hypothetical protein
MGFGGADEELSFSVGIEVSNSDALDGGKGLLL